jgi:molybdopterin-guanine dinucleotide biosynthesis protein A
MGGSPKGLEIVGTSRIIDRVADALRRSCRSVILAANDEKASEWLPNTVVVPDLHAGTGGLAGVEAALRHSGDVIVVAWDMPFVPAALLEELTRRARAHGAAVVIPESDSPHGFEPFCAFYSARVLQRLSEFLNRGGGPARDFIAETEDVHRIALNDLGSFGDAATMFLSVNSPADLDRARTIVAAAG